MNSVQIILVYSFVSIHPFSKRYITGIASLVVASIPLFFLLNSLAGDVMIVQIDLSVAMLLFTVTFVTIEILFAWFSGLLTQSEKAAIHESIHKFSSGII
jgi:hypothetical protein